MTYISFLLSKGLLLTFLARQVCGVGLILIWGNYQLLLFHYVIFLALSLYVCDSFCGIAWCLDILLFFSVSVFFPFWFWRYSAKSCSSEILSLAVFSVLVSSFKQVYHQRYSTFLPHYFFFFLISDISFCFIFRISVYLLTLPSVIWQFKTKTEKGAIFKNISSEVKI